MRGRAPNRPSIVSTWLLAVVWPASAARRAEAFGWAEAWLMYLPAAVLGPTTMAWMAASIAEGGPIRGLAVVQRGLGDFVRALWGGGYDTPMAWATVACVTAAGVASLFVSAYALMPLGARDEPTAASFQRMLKRLLVASPWVIGAALLIGAVAWMAWACGVGWIDSWNLSGWIGVWSWAAALTIGWAAPVSIAIAGRGARACCRWPPRCEGCGYSLMTLTAAQACPECGRLRSDSVGEHVRPGVLAYGVGSAIASMLVAIGLPWRFGQQLRVSGGGAHELWVGLATTAALAAVLTPVCAAIAIAVFVSTVHGFSWGADPMGGGGSALTLEDVAWFVMGCAMMAAGFVSVIAGVLLVCAALAGSWFSWTAGRNLLPAAAQAACMASPVLLVGPLLMWMSWVVAVPVLSAFDASAGSGAAMVLLGTLLGVWNAGAPAAVGVYFLVAVGIATRAARYANR